MLRVSKCTGTQIEHVTFTICCSRRSTHYSSTRLRQMEDANVFHIALKTICTVMLYESDAMEEGCCEKAGGLPRLLWKYLTTAAVCETTGGTDTLEVLEVVDLATPIEIDVISNQTSY
jgi:hypothetical protein